MEQPHPLINCGGDSPRYPMVRCAVTGEVQPGYALCPHLANDVTLSIGDMTAPTKFSMGVIVCTRCTAPGAAGVALVVCCGPCVEADLLKGLAQA